ncbi:discoidin domain-containing protein [Verrucomicrobiaceae bacterium 227]
MKITNYLTALMLAIPAMASAQLEEVNVALSKPTFGDVAFGASTGRGNDGIDGTSDSGNWTHADYPTSAVPYPGEIAVAPNPYWEVDFGEEFDLTRIQLVDRVDCCDPQRLNGSTITLFDALGNEIGTPISVEGLAVSNPANTAVVDFDNGGAGWTGVARIRIDGLATNQYFQFSEFRAFSMQIPPLPNAALGATVTASGPTWSGQGPEKITDGDLENQSHPLADAGTLGFTYTVDLGQVFRLEEILIYNRADGCCPGRLSNYRVSLHDDDGNGLPGDAVWTADLRTDGSHSGTSGVDSLTAELDPDGVFSGQYIVVENLSDSEYNPQIAELQALTLDAVPEPLVNYAKDALAGYFNGDGVSVEAWGPSPASNVTDGQKGTHSHPLDELSTGYYLEIDMGEVVSVGSVEVTGRLDACCTDRLEDALLELLDADKQVVHSQVMAGQVTTSQIFELSGSSDARFVRITNSNGTGYGPQVAEVRVFAPVGDKNIVVQVQSVDPSTGMVSLAFNSAAGKTYAIFGSSTLQEGNWAGIVDNVASQGEETVSSFKDTFAIGETRRFYRIERE